MASHFLTEIQALYFDMYNIFEVMSFTTLLQLSMNMKHGMRFVGLSSWTFAVLINYGAFFSPSPLFIHWPI